MLSEQKTRLTWDTQRHGHPYGQQCSFKYVYSSSDANYNNNFGYTSGQHRVRGRQYGESTEDSVCDAPGRMDVIQKRFTDEMTHLWQLLFGELCRRLDVSERISATDVCFEF